jgi:hypothetical protein
MKRPDPVMHHLIAAMLYAWSLLAVSIAWHSTSLAAWLTATVVCYLAAIAAYQALQASWRAWREHKEVPPVVQTAPTFGFGPCRVVDAPPVAWMAPVATAMPSAAGRHAGTPASSLSEWGAHEYAGGAA